MQLVHELLHDDLVGNGDVAAHEAHRLHRPHRLFDVPRLHGQRKIKSVKPHRGIGVVVHLRGGRMAERPPDERGEFRIYGNRQLPVSIGAHGSCDPAPFLVCFRLREDHQEDEDAERQAYRARDESLEERHKFVLRPLHRPPVVRVEHRTKDYSQHHRARRVPVQAHEVAQHAESYHVEDVHHAVLDRVGTYHGEDYHYRHDYAFGDLYYFRKGLDAEQAQNEERHVRHYEKAHYHPEEVRRLYHQHRSRLEAVDEEPADDDRRDSVSRDAQGQHRDEGPAYGSLVGRLRGDYAFVSSLPEGRLGIARGAFSLVVGKQRRHVPSGSRKRADEYSEQRGAQAERQEFKEGGEVGHDFAEVLFRRVFTASSELGQRLGDAEESDHRRDEADASHEVEVPEGVAQFARRRVHAHHADEDAYGSRHDAFDGISSADAADKEDAHQREQEEVTRREFEREVGDYRRGAGQHCHSNHSRKERDCRAEADRFAGFAALRERVALHSRGDRRRRSRDVEQDRRYRSAVDRSHKYSAHERERVVELPREGEGDEQGDRHRAGEARDRSHPDAGEDSGPDQGHHLPVHEGNQKVLKIL
ncbi:hypothetical protein SDC9_98525 [bioreactor metagenome]|uniref:Uncharacterized protein n=1 Tax=bioreactor metagenome TaxID=1076179 RepID=A0A645AQA3_9ZZZZ